MGRPSTEGRLAKIHAEALEEFEAIQCAQREERQQCRDDRRFCSISGAQWEGALGEQFENKPRLEINEVKQAADRIIGEFRNNRVDVEFLSKDGTPDPTLADTCASLYRSDEQDSKAEQAHINAFREMVKGGFGAWRIRTRYEDRRDGDVERQRIQFDPIFDADTSVFFDLDAKCQDKSDARCCFVLTSKTRAQYEREYDDDVSTWPKSITPSGFDWSTPDVVYIAEYFVVEEREELVRYFESALVPEGAEPERRAVSESEFEEDPDLERVLAVTGFVETGQEKVARRQVHKYVMNGQRVLSDEGLIAGEEIPIVPVYGDREFVDNVERCMGLVRLAKDAQRLKNMLLSMLAELAGMSGNEVPIMTPEEIAGHQVMWSEHNLKRYPYLLRNRVYTPDGQPILAPLEYHKAPTVPPAYAALFQIADSAAQKILGNQQETQKQLSHVAGKTVELLQQNVDANAVLYIHNMGDAIRRGGQIWLSMARDIYAKPGRKLKGIGKRGDLRQIELMKPVIGPDKQATTANDLTRASFDVAVDIGPSSESKRRAAYRKIAELLPLVQDPKTQAVLGPLAVMNVEGEGTDSARKWARRELVAIGVEDPTEEEAQALAAAAQNQQPTPQDVYALAEAEKSKAQAQKALADVELTAAQTVKTKAEAFETLAGIDTARQTAAVDAVSRLQEMQQVSLDQQRSETAASGPGSVP